jgi:hypothetical protein
MNTLVAIFIGLAVANLVRPGSRASLPLSVRSPPAWARSLPVDWFLDRCRTSINVMGDMNVAWQYELASLSGSLGAQRSGARLWPAAAPTERAARRIRSFLMNAVRRRT